MQHEEEKGRKLSAGEVAAIWNERAKAMGYPGTRYNRVAVHSRKEHGDLIPAEMTAHGYLYWEKDARAIALYPQFSSGKSKRKPGQSDEAA